ncbi:ABC transporter ATP-binding protein [Streptomyces sp. NPDC005373]|uniref:ABC transporter ATP-binding protein n=1 Tax=Streptomyces sp. NPDC005373 TaxID=3156879 RepID=UPI00339EA1CE
MNAIHATDVGKEYLTVDDEPVTGLAPVSLDIDEGRFISLVGRSGCGKSTLLKLIAGLEAPSWGELRIGGTTVTEPPSQLRYVFQDYGESLLPWKTVGQNIVFGLKHAHKLLGEEREKRTWPALAEQKLNEVGLADKAGRYPFELSGGQQQRVAIARALAARPDILLLDEPFSAVDALSRATLQDLLLDVWQTHRLTVVFVTHDIDEALYLSDEVHVLAPGGEGIQDHVVVDLPRPRDQLATPAHPQFTALRTRLLKEVLGDGG